MSGLFSTPLDDVHMAEQQRQMHQDWRVRFAAGDPSGNQAISIARAYPNLPANLVAIFAQQGWDANHPAVQAATNLQIKADMDTSQPLPSRMARGVPQ